MRSRRKPHALAAANVTVLQAQTQSTYDATFELPATLAPGAYRLEARHGLPNSTWAAPRDADGKRPGSGN